MKPATIRFEGNDYNAVEDDNGIQSTMLYSPLRDKFLFLRLDTKKGEPEPRMRKFEGNHFDCLNSVSFLPSLSENNKRFIENIVQYRADARIKFHEEMQKHSLPPVDDLQLRSVGFSPNFPQGGHKLLVEIYDMLNSIPHTRPAT